MAGIWESGLVTLALRTLALIRCISPGLQAPSADPPIVDPTVSARWILGQ